MEKVINAALKPEKQGLNALFEPKSVAVIGASRRPEAVGYAVLNNLLTGNFRGKIYPVNPKAEEILGLRCYAAIEDIPGNVDMAILMVHSTVTAAALESCAKKNIKSAIVISAGFREVGPEGLKIEEGVIAAAKKYGIALLGPNCLGLINTDPEVSINASFSRTMPAAGNIAFISQSGALCTAVLDYAKGAHVGFSKFVSLGNKAAVTEMDVLRYLRDDPKTDVILLYLEDLVDARGFIETAREITGDLKKSKPILVIKSGRTAQGAKAAQSHTGSLMGSDEVYDAIFEQAGVLRMDNIEEMFGLAIAMSQQPFPKGDRVAIVTNAGGPGIMTTDACVRYGLNLASFESATVEALKKVLPPTANFHNPVDVIGDAQHDRYEEAIRIVAKDPGVDALIVILTPQAMTDIEETAQVIVKAEKEIDVPLLSCFMGIVDVSAGAKILEENGVPHYRFPEGAAQAMGGMNRYHKWIQRPRTTVKKFKFDEKRIQSVLSKFEGKSFLPVDASMEILQAAGFPVLPFAFAKDAEEAAQKGPGLGFPLALKLISPQVVHKFDFGAVRLNLKDAAELKQACREMKEKFIKIFPQGTVEGFFLQRMSAKGVEVIMGMNRDPRLGPAVMFGLGGIYVEVLKDVTFRLAPLRELSAKMMIEAIRGYKILKGVRGEKPSDIPALEECLQRLSQLSCDCPQIQEIDINPVMVHEKGKGVSVLDGRIILKNS
jgi:acetyl coenzyme A synthetase (ADP forming)-like protein